MVSVTNRCALQITKQYIQINQRIKEEYEDLVKSNKPLNQFLVVEEGSVIKHELMNIEIPEALEPEVIEPEVINPKSWKLKLNKNSHQLKNFYFENFLNNFELNL